MVQSHVGQQLSRVRLMARWRVLQGKSSQADPHRDRKANSR